MRQSRLTGTGGGNTISVEELKRFMVGRNMSFSDQEARKLSNVFSSFSGEFFSAAGDLIDLN